MPESDPSSDPSRAGEAGMPPGTRSRQALDAAHVVVWEWDRDAGLRWEGDAEAVTGCSVEELPLHLSGCDIVAGLAHPDDRDGMTWLCRLVVRVVRRDQEIRWFRCRGQVSADPAGAPARLVGTALDVTRPG